MLSKPRHADRARFDGRRFIDPASMTPTQKTAFHPFGAGSRICLGIHLAYLEMRLAVALFFRQCRGARISGLMMDAMMEEDNRFLIAPKGHCLYVTLGSRGG
jgi:cytochrome P450